MGAGQLWEAHHRLLGTLQTTFRYTVYIYPWILYFRGVFTTFKSLVSTSPWSTDTAEGTVQG